MVLDAGRAVVPTIFPGFAALRERVRLCCLTSAWRAVFASPVDADVTSFGLVGLVVFAAIAGPLAKASPSANSAGKVRQGFCNHMGSHYTRHRVVTCRALLPRCDVRHGGVSTCRR
jgi:hypothetical protein